MTDKIPTQKPMTAAEMWKAGYRQHPVTKEWLPRDEVVAAVEALKTAKK